MPGVAASRMRTRAFKTVVVFRLGPALGPEARWNSRTHLPTLADLHVVVEYAEAQKLDATT